MSALAEIRYALAGLRPPPAGSERIVLVGFSAAQSITAAVMADPKLQPCVNMIGGYPLRSTNEFDGWVIRDCDMRGRWHDAA